MRGDFSVIAFFGMARMITRLYFSGRALMALLDQPGALALMIDLRLIGRIGSSKR